MRWQWWNPTNPPSGALPRFPVWEVTALLFVAAVGVQGLLTPTPSRIASLLVGWTAAWYSALIAGGLLGLAGMVLRGDTGLMVSLLSSTIIATAVGSVATALIVITGEFWYPSSTSFYVFLIGSTWRSVQLVSQLRRMAAALHDLPDRDDR